MEVESIFEPMGLVKFNTTEADRIVVGPGCYRWDIPSVAGVRAWIVEIERGAQWPHVDVHDEMGEVVFVCAGELIEGTNHYGPGTTLLFGAGSSHQPRSQTGVRLFGFNVEPRD